MYNCVNTRKFWNTVNLKRTSSWCCRLIDASSNCNKDWHVSASQLLKTTCAAARLTVLSFQLEEHAQVHNTHAPATTFASRRSSTVITSKIVPKGKTKLAAVMLFICYQYLVIRPTLVTGLNPMNSFDANKIRSSVRDRLLYSNLGVSWMQSDKSSSTQKVHVPSIFRLRPLWWGILHQWCLLHDRSKMRRYPALQRWVRWVQLQWVFGISCSVCMYTFVDIWISLQQFLYAFLAFSNAQAENVSPDSSTVIGIKIAQMEVTNLNHVVCLYFTSCDNSIAYLSP